MLPIEFVLRRFAWGSYLKRNPMSAQPGTPQRFDVPVIEKFHKHALVVSPASSSPKMMIESEARELYLRDGRWDDGVYTDPMIVSQGSTWSLHPAKHPIDQSKPYHSISPLFDAAAETQIIEEILLPGFLGLEAAWHRIDTAHGPIVLADCKFEVGRRLVDGRLVLADVVDNDSWRIWPGGDPTKQIDKQVFRDNAPLAQVADAYSLVTMLTTEFAP
jgi:phosphoribosylaminoimidazole-succinocarboxamide synthase